MSWRLGLRALLFVILGEGMLPRLAEANQEK
jgi:hypothetical protein